MTQAALPGVASVPDILGGARFRLEQLDAVDWLRSLPSESVDLAVTDPAYESLEKYRDVGTTTRLKVSKGSSNEWFPIFPNSRFPALFAQLFRVLKRNTHFYMYCDQETMFVAKPMAEAAGFKFWKPLIFDKVAIGMGYHYRARYELILFFEKGKRKLNDLGVADVIECKRVRGWVCDQCGSQRSIPRDTSKSSSQEDGESSTTSFGNGTTAQSPQASRSTTRTGTSETTPSTTLRSSTPQHTSAFTPAASFETGSGGSHAESAEISSPSPSLIGTSLPTAAGQSSAAADRATFETSSNESKRSACPDCGALRREGFPTEKPVPVSRVLVDQSSQPDELVIDPFMGSGSVGVAALQAGRRFAGTDIVEKAVSLTRGRLESVLEVRT